MNRLGPMWKILAGCLLPVVVALTILEVYTARFAWPIAPSWYWLEQGDAEVRFGCQEFRPVRFSLQPPTGTTRILLVGGSTSFGYPTRPRGPEPLDEPVHGIGGVLQASLDQAWPDQFEIVNIGVNGGASDDTLRLLRRSTGWGASAVVVYDGHNEFLSVPARFPSGLWRFSLVRQLLQALPRVTSSPGWTGPPAYIDAAHRKAVVDVFERNLESILKVSRRADLVVVLATQAANLADLDPNWSTDETGSKQDLSTLSDDELEALWEAHPRSADLAWILGRRRMKEGGDAGAPLRAALDNDGMLLRAPADINRVIREVAEREQVVVVDTQAFLDTLTPVPGNEIFYDWVHPRQVGALLIARGILDGLTEAGVLPGTVGKVVSPQIPLEDLLEGELRAARSWLQWSCVRDHNPRWRLQQARLQARQVLELEPGHREAEAILTVSLARESGASVVIEEDLARRLSSLHPCIAESLSSSLPGRTESSP